MKKLFITSLTLLLLVSCKSKPFTGYVVAKEYIQGHMCCSEKHKHIVQASPIVIVPHPVIHHHTHQWEKSLFIIYVANRYLVRGYHVDSVSFTKCHLGTKKTLR